MPTAAVPKAKMLASGSREGEGGWGGEVLTAASVGKALGPPQGQGAGCRAGALLDPGLTGEQDSAFQPEAGEAEVMGSLFFPLARGPFLVPSGG